MKTKQYISTGIFFVSFVLLGMNTGNAQYDYFKNDKSIRDTAEVQVKKSYYQIGQDEGKKEVNETRIVVKASPVNLESNKISKQTNTTAGAKRVYKQIGNSKGYTNEYNLSQFVRKDTIRIIRDTSRNNF